MLSPDELLKLAHAYAAAEDILLSTVGIRACNHNKIFSRIIAGQGISTRSMETLERFFRTQWPAGAAWPEGIPNPPGRLSRRRRNKTLAATLA